jgi:hypothetical protein
VESPLILKADRPLISAGSFSTSSFSTFSHKSMVIFLCFGMVSLQVPIWLSLLRPLLLLEGCRQRLHPSENIIRSLFTVT